MAFAVGACAVVAAPAYAIATGGIDFWSREPAPTVIKKRFEALFVTGAPPSMDPHAIVSETRRVTTFTVDGQEFPLWVAPTATGHVCAEFVGYAGGCTTEPGDAYMKPGEEAPWRLNLIVGGILDHGDRHNYLSGIITDGRASRLELELSDGTTQPLTFVWVSAPINAGFFMTSLPPNDATAQPVAVKLFDPEGHLIAESSEVQSPARPGRCRRNDGQDPSKHSGPMSSKLPRICGA